jgi:hypothetical protein
VQKQACPQHQVLCQAAIWDWQVLHQKAKKCHQHQKQNQVQPHQQQL